MAFWKEGREAEREGRREAGREGRRERRGWGFEWTRAGWERGEEAALSNAAGDKGNRAKSKE